MTTNEQLKHILSDMFSVPADNIAGTFSMQDTDAWDSLKHMELIISLESEFGVQFTADEITEMLNFEKIESILNKKGVLT